MLINAIILALFAGGFAGLNKNSLLEINPVVAGLAGLGLIAALITVVIIKEERLVIGASVTFVLQVITLLTLIATSGGLDSPYIALWMLAGSFAAMFGTLSLVIVAVAANGLLAYLVMQSPHGVSSDHLMMFVLAVDLPLIVSYIIWHKKKVIASAHEAVVEDLTKQLSKAASESAVVIEAIADGVMSLDEKGSIHLFNPASAQLTGWSQDEAINLDYKSVFQLETGHGKRIEGADHPVEQVRSTKQVLVNNDLTLVTKTKGKLLVSLVVSPVLHDDKLLGVIVVFRDITKEKQEERNKAEFVSTASHEMRTPVAAIEGYLSLSLNPKIATIDDKSRDYLTKALENVNHLGTLFRDLLTISRSEDGRLDQNLQITNIITYTMTIIEGLESSALKKGLTLTFAQNQTDPTHAERSMSPVYFAEIDRDHYREVVANLIENAIKYTHTGTVVVSVDGDASYVRISVKDSGIGIPESDISHLFEKFYRVDNSDTREIGGTGLGLYICRRLVESMKGRIWAESVHGEGSTFFIELPRLSNVSIQQLKDSTLIEEVQKQVVSAMDVQPKAATPVPSVFEPSPITPPPSVQPSVIFSPIPETRQTSTITVPSRETLQKNPEQKA